VARPPLPVGTWGKIRRTELPSGRWQAATRFRDYDGKTREVTAQGGSGAAAERSLVIGLSNRAYQADADITGDTRIRQLAELWLEEIEGEGGREDTTIANYRGVIAYSILPVLGDLRVKELTVSRADRFVKEAMKRTPGQASRIKGLLTWMLDMAVRHEAIRHNPMTSVTKVNTRHKAVRAMTEGQLKVIRDAVRAWRQPGPDGRRPPGPPPTDDLADIIEMFIATGARINEVLAIRDEDVELGTDKATVTISGTLKSVKGKGVVRKPTPKTDASFRTLTLPDFAANLLLRRRVECPPNDLGAVFTSRNGTWKNASNVRRTWREIRLEIGMEWVTPHHFRKTVATIIERELGSKAAAAQLGHTSPSVTHRHYIEQSHVAPDMSEMLQRRLAREPLEPPK